MNKVATELYRTKKTLKEVCEAFGIPLEECHFEPLETCSNCDVWWKSEELRLDLDGNPICRVCVRFYGL